MAGKRARLANRARITVHATRSGRGARRTTTSSEKTLARRFAPAPPSPSRSAAAPQPFGHASTTRRADQPGTRLSQSSAKWIQIQEGSNSTSNSRLALTSQPADARARYNLTGEMLDDLKLIYSNAVAYNGEKHDVAVQAKELVSR